MFIYAPLIDDGAKFYLAKCNSTFQDVSYPAILCVHPKLSNIFAAFPRSNYLMINTCLGQAAGPDNSVVLVWIGITTQFGEETIFAGNSSLEDINVMGNEISDVKPLEFGPGQTHGISSIIIQTHSISQEEIMPKQTRDASLIQSMFGNLHLLEK